MWVRFEVEHIGSQFSSSPCSRHRGCPWNARDRAECPDRGRLPRRHPGASQRLKLGPRRPRGWHLAARAPQLPQGWPRGRSTCPGQAECHCPRGREQSPASAQGTGTEVGARHVCNRGPSAGPKELGKPQAERKTKQGGAGAARRRHSSSNRV